MSNTFPITEAQIVGLFMESICYGIYLVTLGLCIRALLFQREKLILKRARNVNWAMLFVAFLMAVVATFDVAFGLRHNLDAFIFYTGPGGPTVEFSDISYWVNIMKSADYVAQTAIGDAILIYRMYMVYERSWKISIIPIILWITALVCGSAFVWAEIATKHSAFVEDSQTLTKWIASLCVLTVVLNVFVTSLIIWRLWSVRMQVISTASNPDRLKRIIRIVLDSGLMYTIGVIAFFATVLGRSNALYGVSDVIVQVIGITFNLIIVRVNNAEGPTAGLIQSTMIARGGRSRLPKYLESPALTPITFSPHGRSAEVTIDVSQVTDTAYDDSTTECVKNEHTASQMQV